jgi:hypothetical protein
MTMQTHRAPRPFDINKLPAALNEHHQAANLSGRYGLIPTTEIVTALAEVGFEVVGGHQARAQKGNEMLAKHVLRLRHPGMDFKGVGDSVPEVLIVNSHNGRSAYQVKAGVYRLVCSNGLIIGNDWAQLKVKHTLKAVEGVVEASLKVIDVIPKAREVIGVMQAVTLNQAEQLAFAEVALGLRFEKGTAPIEPVQLLTARRADDHGNDLWRTFNRVQEGLVRGGQRGTNPETKARTKVRALTGIDPTVRVNEMLWQFTEALARQKA